MSYAHHKHLEVGKMKIKMGGKKISAKKKNKRSKGQKLFHYYSRFLLKQIIIGICAWHTKDAFD